MFSWFSAIQPLKTFHFGGDEVAATAWLQSPLCDGTNKTDLKLNFTQRVTQDIASMGLAVGAWEDGVMDEHNNAYDINTLTDDVTVYAWSNIWEWGHGDRAYRLANAGYKVDGYTLHDDVIKWNHFPRYCGHLCGEFTGPRGIPLTKASDAELWCFLWSGSE